MEYVGLIWALTTGNFIYATIKSKNYDKALEISFFQAIAIILCWYLIGN